jgi:hypothetical protein
MADRKDRMSLLSRYSKLYTARYGQRPDHNLNKEQWSADNLVESYTLYKCYDLLEYYFSVAASPNWRYFANNADNILAAKEQVEQDKLERAERRRLAKEWLNE